MMFLHTLRLAGDLSFYYAFAGFFAASFGGTPMPLVLVWPALCFGLASCFEGSRPLRTTLAALSAAALLFLPTGADKLCYFPAAVYPVRLAYTGQQAFTQQRPVLTGACAERRTLTLLGRSWQLPGSGALPDDIPPRVRWLPLRLGRLALPGCVQETTCWARETQEQTFTPETAAALARRSARLQLLQDYPDAVIESERDFASTTATAAVCRAVFVFCANIAEPRSAPAASG